MKFSFSTLLLLVGFTSNAFSAEGYILSRDSETDTWRTYSVTTKEKLYKLNDSWSTYICYSGDLARAKMVVEMMAANEGLPGSYVDEDGKEYVDQVIIRADKKKKVLNLKVKVYDERGGYKFTHVVKQCS